jgi:superfamily I DNA/RNA helicase
LRIGIAPREIAVFTRAPDMLHRARAAVHSAGAETLELSDRTDDPGERVSIGTMHLANGLEFKAVAVMACDEDALPLRSRIDAAADEAELEDVYDTERQLLYVAATIAAGTTARPDQRSGLACRWAASWLGSTSQIAEVHVD